GWVVAGVAYGNFGRRDRIEVYRVGRDGADAALVDSVLAMARYGILTGPSPFGGVHPLSPTSHLAVRDGRIYLAESLTPRIRVFDAGSGEHLRDIEWEVTPAGEPEEVFRAVVGETLARAAPERQATLRRQLEVAEVPDSIPLFWKLRVDSEGFIWIRPYEPMTHAFGLGSGVTGGTAAPGGTWLVLTPDGSEVARVEVPPDLEIEQITRDAVVGIARDEFDVETVRVHPLRRR
ncbi:MAG: hypothetical protein RQ745_06760, partial [Longimicrobiales bacterium]|nr:hypothetical protein [Longimicrobiales bacterium]